MIENKGSSGRRAESRHASEKLKWSVTLATLCTRVPNQHHRRTFGKRTEKTWAVGNGLYLLRRIAGSKVSFLVDTGFGVSILAARIWREWDRRGDELAKYKGQLCL